MSDTRKPSPAAAPQDKFDAEFDAFLHADDSRLAALYRKLPHPEPDAALDARVRAQARQALRESGDAPKTQTRSAAQTRMRRWLPAFGMAATLVLVAGLAWRLMPPQTSPTDEAAPIAGTAAPVAAQGERNAPPPTTTPAPPSPSAPSQVPAAMPDHAALYRHKLHRADNAKPESAGAADETMTDSRSAATGAPPAAPKAAAPAFAAPPASAGSALPPRSAGQPGAKSAPPPAGTSNPPPPPPPTPEATMDAETTPPASVAAATPAPAPRETANANHPAAAALASADRASARESPPVVVTPDSSAPARYRWEIADAAGATPVRGIYPPDPPPLRAWVEVVRAMLRDGHRDAARQALAELRVRHPDFRVPSDLHGLE